MTVDDDLTQRLRGAAPPPGPPPDVPTLWHRSRRARRGRVAAAAVAAGAALWIGGAAGMAALRPGVELEQPAAQDPSADTAEDDDAGYCVAAAPFLGVAADPPTVDPGGDGSFDAMTPDDLRASHEALREEFADAAAAAPPELAADWEAVRADHAAQGEVWEARGWDVDDDGFPDLLRELNSLPTSHEADRAVARLAADYEERCSAP